MADVNLLTEDELEYIEIIVNPWAFPVNYNGEYHYRSGSTKQQLRGNELTNFLISKTGLTWDAATITDISVDDLDKESFDIFRREALRSGKMTKEDLDISNREFLEKLDLMEDGKLKRAGALCFYRKAEKVISGFYVKTGKFEGSDLLYQDEVNGSLLIIADRVIDLIYLKYLKAAISYHKETRVETYPFARDAVREAVFNALIHCNWADNIPIKIRIEEDAMYISNNSMCPLVGQQKHCCIPILQNLLIQILLKFFIGPVTLKVGGVAFKKYVMPAKRLAQMSQSILFMAGTLCLNLMHFKG